MIDGFKILVGGTAVAEWLQHIGMDFLQNVNYKTGEIEVKKPLVSEIKGLHFFIKPSNKQNAEPILEVKGSLHRFANNGGKNNDDFIFARICQTIAVLKKFKIDPSKAKLLTVEFGVNIFLPDGMTCERFINSLVCRNDREFVKSQFVKNTAAVESKRGDTLLKIYDKTEAEKSTKSNLLRVEIKVLKMRYLKTIEIKTLQDLTDYGKIKLVGELIQENLMSIILFDKHHIKDFNNLPIHEERNFWRWISANFWSGVKGMKRLREKQKFNEACQKYGFENLQSWLNDAVNKKWVQLLGENGIGLCYDCTTFEKNKIGNGFEIGIGLCYDCTTFEKNKIGIGFEIGIGLCYDCTIRIKGAIITSVQNDSEVKCNKLEPIIFLPKIEKKQNSRQNNFLPKSQNLRICVTCSVDISHKRPQSIFCSEKCRFEKNNKKRDRKKKENSENVNFLPKTDLQKNESSQSKASGNLKGTGAVSVNGKVLAIQRTILDEIKENRQQITNTS